MATRGSRRYVGGLQALGLLCAGAALAACGSSAPSANRSTTTSSAPSHSSGTSPATVQTAKSSAFGTILVDSSGQTLYMLTADSPTSPACTASCLDIWLPLKSPAAPRAGSGVSASLLATVTRTDGTRQVSYNGHLLYTFSGDSAKGQVKGEGIASFGGTWYVLDAAGSPVTAPVAGSTTTTSGGYGS